MKGGGSVRGGLEEEEQGDERSRILWKGQLDSQAVIGPDHTCTDLRSINGSSNYSNSRQLA